jgi:hypothetical protein
MFGLAGIMTALAVITAAHGTGVPPAHPPAVHTMAPSGDPVPVSSGS